MTILSLDPGKACGWAVIQYDRPHARLIASGTIQPAYHRRDHGINARETVQDMIAAGLAPLVFNYGPDEIAYEGPAAIDGPHDWSSLGAYDAAKALHDVVNDKRRKRDSEGRDIPWGLYTPVQVVNTLYGVGNSPGSKAAVRKTVERLLCLHRRDLSPCPGYHRSDAVAVALCHLARAHGFGCDVIPHLHRRKVADATIDRLTERYRMATGRTDVLK